MKSWLLFPVVYFFISTISAQQFYRYIIETPPIDTLYVIENGKPKMVTSDTNRKDLYLVNTHAWSAEIKAICQNCTDTLTIIINDYSAKRYKEGVKIRTGESVSLAQLLNNKNDARKGELGALWSKISEFFNAVRVGPIGLKHTVTKSLDNGPGKEGPKMEYIRKGRYAHFWDFPNFAVAFEKFNKLGIKSIYIISHDKELVFFAGDTTLIGSIFDLKNRKLPAVMSIINTIETNSNTSILQINWESISNHLFIPMESGQVYQLGIELQYDDPKYGVYLFDFDFLTNEQKKRIEDFAKNDSKK